MSQRFILTGAPGAGKTVLLRALEMAGHVVVEEAATDVIALRQAQGDDTPWRSADFIGDIAALQLQRQKQPRAAVGPQFHDRSVFCTMALARHLGHPVPALLERGMAEARASGFFANTVFFVELLGFITPTEGRRIGLAEALEFGRLHEETYRSYGFDLVWVPPGDVAARAQLVLAHCSR